MRPTKIADMDRKGVASVVVYCQTIGCGHRAEVGLTGWDRRVFVPDMDLRLRCARCGAKGNGQVILNRPDWPTLRDMRAGRHLPRPPGLGSPT